MGSTCDIDVLDAMQALQIQPSVESTRSLPDIPQNLYPEIASYLDHGDLYSLLEVAKAFQVPAETYLWRELNLLVPWKCTQDNYCRSMEQLDAALTRCPHRAASVRDLLLSEAAGVAFSALCRILSKVAPYITSLKLDFDISACAWCYEQPEDIYKAIMSIRAPNVTKLEVDIGYDNAYLLEAMLHSLPNIKSLMISSTDLYNSPLPEPPSIFNFAKPLALNCLESMTIFRTYLGLLGIITGIVNASPNLQEAEMMGDAHGDPFPEYQLLMAALGRCKKLKTLSPAWYYPSLRAYDPEMEAPAFPGLKGIRVWQEHLGRQRGGLTVINELHIPPISGMTYMQPWVEYIDNGWSTPLSNPPTDYRLVDKSVIRQLGKARQLDNMMFVINFHLEPQLPPDQWCAYRRDGITIRSYTDGIVELFDIRQLTLCYRTYRKPRREPYTHVEYPDECQGEGVDHDILKWSWYEGERVGQDIMDEVYRLSGVSDDWTVCGRGMELLEASWEFLKAWKESSWETNMEGLVSPDY